MQILHNEITHIDNDNSYKLNKILNDQVSIIDSKGIDYNICSVDGTCDTEIKGNKTLYTNMSVHIYNNTEHIPYSIINNTFSTFQNNKNNNSNKNHEIKLLEKFIDENKLTNVVLLLDRAYASYTLINKLIQKNIKFVIRLKDNFEIINDNIKKSNNNFKLINNIKNNKHIKIVKNTITSDKILTTNTNTKKIINTTSYYYLITNLGNAQDYSDELIINLYKKRWEIETFFGHIKTLFKYETFRLKNEKEINKMKNICDIIFILTKILIFITLCTNFNIFEEKLKSTVKSKFNKNKNDMRFKKHKESNKIKSYETKVNINFSHFYNKLCSKYLNLIIDGELNINTLDDLKHDIIIKKDKYDRKYERKSLVPFTKWYVKMYHKFYKDKKIYEAIINEKIDTLDKNLKSIANKLIKTINK